MNYQDHISQSQQKVYEKAVATKILDLMDKLRLSSSENNKRRWIWELLQNAKDVKSRQRNEVDIAVNFNASEKILIFRHNGRCFSTDNITFLIEQVSTKERSTDNPDETTGKFGTGFLTTHLLSEIVEVQGIVKDGDLPYRKFCISLDRSSKTIEEVTISLKTSIDQLKQLDQGRNIDNYDENEFNTSFVYHLDENGLDTAEVGIQDLQISLPLTLLFLPAIKSVKIENELSIYSILSRQLQDVNNLNLNICQIQERGSAHNNIYEFALVKEHLSEIAIPIRCENSLVFIDDSRKNLIPRIFCDFPLVGSEKFGVPFFINSSHLYPTEPRDGIFLSDKDDDRIELNKKILQESVSSYLKLIDYASSQNWSNLYRLAEISRPPQTEWISIDWHEENIIKPIQDKVYNTPLVKTEDGNKFALQKDNNIFVDIPFDKRLEVREAIWNLVHGVDVFCLPAQSEFHQWYEIFKDKIWNKKHRLTIELLSQYMTKDTPLLEDLSNKFNLVDSIKWLNQYFSLLQLAEEDCLNFLEKGNYKLIPNQDGELCLPNNLNHDSGIEKELKDIGSQLFKNYYAILANESISISEQLPHKFQKSVISEINQALRSKTNDISLDKKKQACYTLSSLFPANDSDLFEGRCMIYNISKKIFGNKIVDKKFLNNWSPEVLEVSDQMQVEFIVQQIFQFKTIHNLSTSLSDDINNVRDWLSAFVRFIVDSGWKGLLEKETPILPNQNGTFCGLDSLSVEGEEIDEALKNISFSLRRDFRDELIDVGFDINLPKNRRIFQKDIGREIKELVMPLLSELTRRKETQIIFDELILWMNDNPDVAKDIFEELFENRHKLYDDAEVAKNLRQVRELQVQVKDLSQENQSLQNENEELRSQLEKLKAQLPDEQYNSQEISNYFPLIKKPINDEFLITYGITTVQQLERILLDPEIAQKYVDLSESDYDPLSRLQYVLEIINRAKQNVRRHLESLEDYDCSAWYEHGITYISGVLKQNTPIEIIVRPSDNKKIIFYYLEEKQVLSVMNSELWVENGQTLPHQVTLGMVLQIKNINQIDLP